LFLKTTFKTFTCLFIIVKDGKLQTPSSVRKILFGFHYCFGRNTLFKNYIKKILYYLFIMSNFIINLLIAIYFV